MSKERAIQLRLEGNSISQIAEILGRRPSGALSRWLKGVPPPEWTKRPTAKDELHERAVELRLKGWSYGEIAAEISVSKSTLSDWLRDVLLEPDAAERLNAVRNNGQKKAAALRRSMREAREREIKDTAKAQMPSSLSGMELFLAGLALYWAEGSKSKPWNVSGRVNLINSDPDVIRVFLAWLALIGVERNRLSYRVAIHETGDADRAEAFWSSQLGIPRTSLDRTTIKRHPQSGIRRLPRDQYFGCLRVDVRRSTDLLRQIEGWWPGLVTAAVSVEAPSGMV